MSHPLRAMLREAIIPRVGTTRMRTRQIYSVSVIRLLLLLVGVSPAVMAQLIGLPQYGVLLSGTPDNPVVLNQSLHRILAFALRLRRGDQDRFSETRSNQVGLNQLTRGYAAGPDGPGIPPGGTSLSLPQMMPTQTRNPAGQRTDIGFTEATLDSVLFDDGLFVGPDFIHIYESITARITAEVSVDSLLLSAKTDRDFAAAWYQIKQIAETPSVYHTPASEIGTAGRGVLDPNFSLRQLAIRLLAVRDRLGEKAAVARAAASLA
jgi:hypothetical protein